MKKWTEMLVAGILVLGLAGGAFAADNHNVEVAIADIALIDASAGPVQMTLTTAVAGTDLGVDSDNGQSLSFSHNQDDQIITAVATEVDVSTNDITLTLELTGGAGSVNIIAGGIIQSAQTLRDNVVRGAYDAQGLTYGASASLSGSVPYTNIWKITFTMTDT